MSPSHSPYRSPTSRPPLGARSISQVNPLTTPQGEKSNQGTRLSGRGNLFSGEMLPLGARLPDSPFLPLPPASNAPLSPPPTKEKPIASSSLAMRRMRKHDSEFSSSERPQLKRGHSMNPSSEPRVGLRINTLQAASTPSNKMGSSPRSAGMTRSYSSPVATQDELDEQKRIMANAASSPLSSKTWWSYGFQSYGGGDSPISAHPPSLKSSTRSMDQAAQTSPLMSRSALSPLTMARVSGNIPETISEAPLPPQPVFLRKASTVVETSNNDENAKPKVEDDCFMDVDSQDGYFSPRKSSNESVSDDDEATTPTPTSYTSPFGLAQHTALKKLNEMQGSPIKEAEAGTWAPYEGFINPAHFA